MNKLLSFIFILLASLSLQAQNITLAWNPNAETNLVGYFIYQGTNSRNYIGTNSQNYIASYFVPTPNTNFNVLNLNAGQTYYFAVTATNTDGQESVFSSEISYATSVKPTLTLHPEYYLSGTNIYLDEGTGASYTNFISSFTNMQLSWNSLSGILQYSTNLFGWVDYPGGYNGQKINVKNYSQIFFRLRDETPVVATNVPFSLYTINSRTSSNSTTIFNLNNLPTNSLLVATVANEGSLLDCSFVSSPGLSWVKKADAQLGNSGDCELHYAKFSNGGNINITNSWNAANKMCSSVLYVFVGASDVSSNNFNVSVGQSLPNSTINTTKTNSIIICVNSDWYARVGAVTYLNTPVTESLRDYVLNKYQSAHWIKYGNNIGSYNLGQSAPSGQASGFIIFVVSGN